MVSLCIKISLNWNNYILQAFLKTVDLFAFLITVVVFFFNHIDETWSEKSLDMTARYSEQQRRLINQKNSKSSEWTNDDCKNIAAHPKRGMAAC